MELLNKLEAKLAHAYKDTPKLSHSAKTSIVGIWPLVALVFGILQILAAVELWHLGHEVNKVADLVDSLGPYTTTGLHIHLNAFYWLSLIVVAVDGVLLIAAFPALQKHQKTGWNLLFYASLLNLFYGIFSALNGYGGVVSLLLQIIVSAVVLYFLFQIRDHYTSVTTHKHK